MTESRAHECVECALDMFRLDGRTKSCREAGERYHEIIATASDEELQEIAMLAKKLGWNLEELKDRRRRFRKTLGLPE